MNLQSDIKAVELFQKLLTDNNLFVRLTPSKTRELKDGGLLIEQPALQVTFITPEVPATPAQPAVPSETASPETPVDTGVKDETEVAKDPIEPPAPEAFPPVDATTETATPTAEEVAPTQ